MKKLFKYLMIVIIVLVVLYHHDRHLYRRLRDAMFASGAVALVTRLSGGSVGYYFAGFYVLSSALRPIGALYSHLRARLEELRERSRYPREDVVSMRDRVEQSEATLKQLDADMQALRTALGTLPGRNR